MHSIRFRFTMLTIAAIIVCVLGVGGSSALSVKSEGDRDSAEKMLLICEKNTKDIDAYLNSIEQSVNMVSRFAIDEMDSVELVKGGVIGLQGTGERSFAMARSDTQQENLDAYLESYYGRVETLFHSVANRTNGAVAFYLRMNTEISGNSCGFFYSNIGRSTFRKLLLTDISLYEPDDVEHVGWYYIPLSRGQATWIEPYKNQNLGIRMISYVTPLYKAGTFIGVVGMDISYDTLVSQINDIHVFDTGFAFLTRSDGTVIYHPTIDAGQSLADLGALTEEDIALLQEQDSNDEPMRYEYKGVEKQMFFNTLANGLKLIVTAPVKEINAPWLRLMARIILVSTISLITFLLISVYMVRRMTEPLLRLTEASESIQQGKYDVRLDYQGQDEVGALTATFQHLVDHLNVYISDLNSRAYQDALTSVRNRGAFTIAARKLNDAIRAAETTEDQPGFALVMLDCNDLKHINDTYGHEKGDQYLRTSCKLICKMFPHSPVFRMGGDEFAVLLRDAPYDDREALLDRFDDAAAEAYSHASEAWERVSLAKGTAIYTPGKDTCVEDVLSRADELMYADKKRIKAARGR